MSIRQSPTPCGCLLGFSEVDSSEEELKGKTQNDSLGQGGILLPFFVGATCGRP